MTDVDVTTSFARSLADEWARCGVSHAVVSPGSRNTPIVLALARDGRFEVDVVLDERSAAFRALGIAAATGRPAVVCCTSGTAAANLHPAVVEAHHARVPMLVVTADRPPELRDCGAGQTIDQVRLFGTAVRWFADPGPPSLGTGEPARWRALACRAYAGACGPPAGPVHLNLPFAEPLVPTGAPLVPDPGRAAGAPWTRPGRAGRIAAGADVARVAGLVAGNVEGVVVAGWGAGVDHDLAGELARRTGWPVLADPLSQLRRGAHAISTYEALLRTDAFASSCAPACVLHLGAPLTSRVANAWLGACGTHVLVDPDGAWLDPRHDSAEHVGADAGPFLRALVDALGPLDRHASAWAAAWHDAERRARAAIDEVLDASPVASEARIARDLAAAVPAGGALVVASSLPVRALEWTMAPRERLHVLANRGANGIDGFTSTVGGVARALSAAPAVVGLCGDLCFLHDTNGLLALPSAGPGAAPTTIVVADNAGGGIFGYLPQRALPELEDLFVTPPRVDVAAVARAHGVGAERVEAADIAKFDWSTHWRDGIGVLVVAVDQQAAMAEHERMWSAVATAIGA
jgi:2-succinyl-5-enolpyruvyl-6-hydroxy-3-cyclohexene-1-carboxylate synthase